MTDIVAVYGQKKIPVPAGWTQEQVKAQMARFFPELADPKIESKKDGDKTEWVFSKKAGTKGAAPAQPDRAHALRNVAASLVAYADKAQDEFTEFVGASEFEANMGGPFDEDDELGAIIEAARSALAIAPPLPEGDHQRRHVELHQAFDELLADWIAHSDGIPSRTVFELMEWSYQQT